MSPHELLVRVPNMWIAKALVKQSLSCWSKYSCEVGVGAVYELPSYRKRPESGSRFCFHTSIGRRQDGQYVMYRAASGGPRLARTSDSRSRWVSDKINSDTLQPINVVVLLECTPGGPPLSQLYLSAPGHYEPAGLCLQYCLSSNNVIGPGMQRKQWRAEDYGVCW